ncbi:hypothetical protein WN944_024314 [Citrus x changshan-huyou]|uniref:Retrotransposon gag domain-containing protein n=1 Tax=Citrus x changshan-huyou TaxID=2935761 RepID=A0AAP0QFL0_9ROSI
MSLKKEAYSLHGCQFAVQQESMVMEVKETNKHANGAGKSLGYIDNLISFIEDKFNCLDKRLKKIEANVQKIDSLEENTSDMREMSGQINKIVDLGEFLNSAYYNLKTTVDNDLSIVTPATVEPSLTTNFGILKKDPIIIPSTQQEERPFKDYFSPLANLSTSYIRYPNVTVRSFELKPSVLNCLPTFYGLENEDPYNHLNGFHAICQTFKYENFSDDDVKLRLFPFSLKDRAHSWLNTLPTNSITSWEQMVTKFLNKYFSVHKTNAIRREISEFTQREDEQFFETWERFNGLLLKCPHHEYEKWHQCQYFLEGLLPNVQEWLMATSGGELMSKSGGELMSKSA